MNQVTKVKEWIKQNAPTLSLVYENKYSAMLYDRFASLPARQQRQVIFGSFGGVIALMLLGLLGNYLNVWSIRSQEADTRETLKQVQNFQRQQALQGSTLQVLDRNSRLAPRDELKRFITEQCRSAGISLRSIQADEDADVEDLSEARDIKVKRASVKLNRINLLQLKNVLASVENGPFLLSIESLRISNDEKVRGYLKAEFRVIAYLFQSGDTEG